MYSPYQQQHLKRCLVCKVMGMTLLGPSKALVMSEFGAEAVFHLRFLSEVHLAFWARIAVFRGATLWP